ncbi:MAG: SGNH/GDSL hydrolase family protein [Flammeovirgaceae bacterium]
MLISKNKVNKRLKDVALSSAFMGILLGIVFCINASMGDDTTTPQSEQGLVFPKNYTVTSKTIEYDYKIITNSLGIRDREISVDKGDKYRILCFGDSWTMGFGVNIEHSWPRKLQEYLHSNQFENVEVINCGKGGQYTTKYLEYMNNAIPLLKPDLVLVGVLQLDDLAQLYEHSGSGKKAKKAKNTSIKSQAKHIVKTYGKYSFGNLLKKKSNNTIDLKQNNINDVKNKIAKYDYLQKKQYDLLSDSVRHLFETGNLNPGLLNYYVSLTYRPTVFNNPDHPATKLAINSMDKDLKEMKALCTQHNANLVFVNMPTASFTGHATVRTPNDQFNDFMKEHNGIDSIYQNIALQNELTYFELTDYFIELVPKDKYFFKFDGHPNENGYAEIAKYIGNELVEQNLIK